MKTAEHSQRSIINIIIDCIILCTALMLSIAYLFDTDKTKYFLFSNIGLSVLIFIIYLFRKVIVVKSSVIFMILTIIAATFYSLLFCDNIPKLAIFISSILFAFVVYDSGLDKYNLQILLICAIFLAFQIIYESFQADSYFRNGSLVLAYKNPNMAGIVISNIMLILIVGFFYNRKKWAKILLALLVIVTLYLLFKTENRGSIIAVTVALFLIFIYRKGKMINEKLRKFFILIPIVILMIYTTLLNIIPLDTMLLGKPLFSGREIGWKYAIESIVRNPFSAYSYGRGALNLLLWSVTQFGILAVIFYFIFIILLKPKMEKTTAISFQLVAYISFMCLFIQQSFENTLIGGDYSVYIFSYLLLGLSSTKIGLKK